jgi:acetolactate synthase-1/2/3 large subunit
VTGRPADRPEVSDVLMGALRGHGVENLWFTSGTELAFFQEAYVKGQALGREVPRIRTAPHEHVALAAAAGETRVTGRPSAVAVHVDLGLMNMGGAIHNAYHGAYPVLMMSGHAPSAPVGTVRGGRDAPIQWFQQLRDQGQNVRQYTKWDHRLAPYDAPELIVARALQVAMTPRRGPVYLALPREAALAEAAPPLDARRVSLPPAVPGGADEDRLREVARALVDAQAPVVSADLIEPEAARWLLELAELVGAPVISEDTLFALPAEHPLARGDARAFPLPAATDFVLAVESTVPWMPAADGRGPWPRVAAIGLDPTVSATPIYDFPAEWALAARPDLALRALVDCVTREATGADRERFRARRERLEAEGHERFRALVAKAEVAEGAGTLTREAALDVVGRALEPEWVLFHELAETPLLRRSRPGTLFGGGGSAIGWAPAAAVGARVARPDLPVVSICGDGGWFFANPTVCLWTARYHRAPVLFVILNNAGYRTGTVVLARHYPQGFAVTTRNFEGGWLSPTPDFAGEARALGCHGEQANDVTELREGLKRAIAAVTGDGVPAVVDVRLPPIGGPR